MLPLVKLSQEEIDRIVASIPGGAANVQDIYPLTPMQEGVLFHHQISDRNDPYVIFTLLGFDHRQRLDHFCQALQKVVDRHDMMRTSIVAESAPQPVQVVWRKASIAFTELTLPPAAEDAGDRLLQAIRPGETHFDFQEAPLIRMHAAKDPDRDRWLLLLIIHSITEDITTLRLLMNEILAHMAGQSAELPPAPAFRNVVFKSRMAVSTEEHDAFFRNLLADVQEPTAPFGMLDVHGDGSRIRQSTQFLDLGLSQRLRTLARQLKTSPPPFATWLGPRWWLSPPAARTSFSEPSCPDASRAARELTRPWAFS